MPKVTSVRTMTAATERLFMTSSPWSAQPYSKLQVAGSHRAGNKRSPESEAADTLDIAAFPGRVPGGTSRQHHAAASILRDLTYFRSRCTTAQEDDRRGHEPSQPGLNAPHITVGLRSRSIHPRRRCHCRRRPTPHDTHDKQIDSNNESGAYLAPLSDANGMTIAPVKRVASTSS